MSLAVRAHSPGQDRSPGQNVAATLSATRRRKGKSSLLRRLAGAVGGLYHLATEQAGPVSLRRFGDSLATWEFPYLAQETLGLPSIVQSLYDGLGPGAGASTASFRLLLRGSAMSVMADLLSGTRALRGRAARPVVRLPGRAGVLGISDPAAAFAHHALVGGTPGYRELVPDPQVPEGPAQLGGWLTRNVLRPSMPLFDGARFSSLP